MEERRPVELWSSQKKNKGRKFERRPNQRLLSRSKTCSVRDEKGSTVENIGQRVSKRKREKVQNLGLELMFAAIHLKSTDFAAVSRLLLTGMELQLRVMRNLCFDLTKNAILKTPSQCMFFKLSIKSWRIVFFGNDFYSLFSLKALHNEMKHKKIASMEVVVTNERNPVFEYSVSNKIPTHFWPPNLNGSYDFGVIVSFGKLIPKSIIELFPLGIINVHASLLPKYRGGMPIVHAIKNGDTSTGVTVTRIKENKFDVGEIILQKPCLIDKNELMPSVYKRLKHLGCECLLEVINNMPNCLDSSFPQSNEGVSYAPKLKKEDALVRWEEMTALEVFNLHRAMFGMFELTTNWQEKPVKFVCLFLTNHNPFSQLYEEDKKPGNFTYCKKTKFLYVQCKDRPITVCTLKYGKKMHRASAFHDGYLQNKDRTFFKFTN